MANIIQSARNMASNFLNRQPAQQPAQQNNPVSQPRPTYYSPAGAPGQNTKYLAPGGAPARQGSVLGASTTAGGGGSRSTSGSASSMSAPQMDQSQLFEQAPGGPDLGGLDAIINPALDALSQQEQMLQGSLPGQLNEIESGSKNIITGLQSEQANRLADFGQQRTREQQATEGTIAEARRQAAEMQQGLQAKFGGSTGTGGFVGELLGRQALQNISGNRQALQNTLAQIGSAENKLKTEVTNRINEEMTRAESAKQQARQSLQAALAEIAGKRGELQSRKAEMAFNAVQNYRNLLSDIESRNAQVRRSLFEQQQAAAEKLAALKARSQDTFGTQLKKFEDVARLAFQGGQEFTPGASQALGQAALQGNFAPLQNVQGTFFQQKPTKYNVSEDPNSLFN